jgi:hypothetical protein
MIRPRTRAARGPDQARPPGEVLLRAHGPALPLAPRPIPGCDRLLLALIHERGRVPIPAVIRGRRRRPIPALIREWGRRLARRPIRERRRGPARRPIPGFDHLIPAPIRGGDCAIPVPIRGRGRVSIPVRIQGWHLGPGRQPIPGCDRLIPAPIPAPIRERRCRSAR